MWYFPLLKPFEDHVPVKADLSDLAEQIKWCRDNDDKCRRIAARAGEIYATYISQEAIRDYMELLCWNMGSRYVSPPVGYTRPDSPCKKFQTRQRGGCNCVRCQEKIEERKSMPTHVAKRSREEEFASSGNNMHNQKNDDGNDFYRMAQSIHKMPKKGTGPFEPKCRRCRKRLVKCKC